MCGIVGVINHSASDNVCNKAIRAMLEHVCPRGPDDSGVWSRDHVGFGHTRLAILDLSTRGHQPFATDDETGVIVFNGEVYNFAVLRQELESEGVRFRSNTDTEVVLHALHTWGVETAVPRFNGMFAFAYADLRDQTVWLARDRLGIKPLFIAHTPHGIAFASEQKSLLAHPDVDSDLDTQATLSMLLYERFDNTETPYQAIETFLPGQILRIHNGEQTWSTYFDLLRDISIDTIRQRQHSFSANSHSFEALITSSVQDHLISDAPLATMCSGGLDSGLVTAIAARHQDRLVSYVADMEGMQGEERRRATLITDHVGAEIRPVYIDQEKFLLALPEAIAANDQPLFFAQDVAAMLIARQMRNDGFKVALTGDGADELFGGYAWHSAAYHIWSGIARRAKWIPNNPLTRRLGRRVPYFAPVDLQAEIERFALVNTPYDYVASPFNVVVTAGMRRTLRQRQIFEELAPLPLAERAFLTKNFDDVYVHMRECLNALDKMAMHYGIEARVPFLENRLMDLGFNLPIAHKYRNGTRKALIHAVAQNWLPRAVIDLPKIGFTAPPVMWRNTLEFLNDGHVARLLKWPKASMHDIYALLRLKPYFSFRLLGSELWLKMHIDGTSVSELGEALVTHAREASS